MANLRYAPENFICHNPKCTLHEQPQKIYAWSNELNNVKCESCGVLTQHVVYEQISGPPTLTTDPKAMQKMLQERSKKHFQNEIAEKKKNMKF